MTVITDTEEIKINEPKEGADLSRKRFCFEPKEFCK
jgi:hypothetical protein